jgi:hypothetical protein
MSSNQEISATIEANLAAIKNVDETLRLLCKSSDSWLDIQTMYQIVTVSFSEIKTIIVNFNSRAAFDETFISLAGKNTGKGFTPILPKEDTISFLYNGLHITFNVRKKKFLTNFDDVRYNPFTGKLRYGGDLLSEKQENAFERKECKYYLYMDYSGEQNINHLKTYIDNEWRFFRKGKEGIVSIKNEEVTFEFLQPPKKMVAIVLDGVRNEIEVRNNATIEDVQRAISAMKLLLN